MFGMPALCQSGLRWPRDTSRLHARGRPQRDMYQVQQSWPVLEYEELIAAQHELKPCKSCLGSGFAAKCGRRRAPVKPAQPPAPEPIIVDDETSKSEDEGVDAATVEEPALLKCVNA